MSGDRFNYYLKMILNSGLEEYALISEQLENDSSISQDEAEELERLIKRYMSVYNRYNLKVINRQTGEEELPPQTMIDNFGETSDFIESASLYGLQWKVYSPKGGFENSPVQRWYYNQHIASILNSVLAEVVPGRVKNYFDIPPWVMGSAHAPGTLYLPLSELATLAISRRLIPDWDYLVKMGLPREMVDSIRAANLGSKL